MFQVSNHSGPPLLAALTIFARDIVSGLCEVKLRSSSGVTAGTFRMLKRNSSASRSTITSEIHFFSHDFLMSSGALVILASNSSMNRFTVSS